FRGGGHRRCLPYQFIPVASDLQGRGSGCLAADHLTNPPFALEDVRLFANQRQLGHGKQDLWIARAGKRVRLGGHADDTKRRTVHGDRLLQDTRIAGEEALPCAVTENDDRRRVRAVVGPIDAPPYRERNAHTLKEIAAYGARHSSLGTSSNREI